MRHTQRSIFEIYHEVERFDKKANRTLNEIEENIIISSGINKQTLPYLGKFLLKKLITNYSLFIPQNEENKNGEFAKLNYELILAFSGLLRFYKTITGKSTYENGGVNDFKTNMADFIRKESTEIELDRKSLRFLLSFLNESENFALSSELISQIQGYDKKDANGNTLAKEKTGIQVFDDTQLWGSDKLTIIQSSIIGKYLIEYHQKPTEVQKNIQKQITAVKKFSAF